MGCYCCCTFQTKKGIKACVVTKSLNCKWLPSDQAISNQWLQQQIEEVDRQISPDPLDPTAEGHKNTIESSAEFTMFFNQMFTEILTKQKQEYWRSPGQKLSSYAKACQPHFKEVSRI